MSARVSAAPSKAHWTSSMQSSGAMHRAYGVVGDMADTRGGERRDDVSSPGCLYSRPVGCPWIELVDLILSKAGCELVPAASKQVVSRCGRLTHSATVSRATSWRTQETRARAGSGGDLGPMADCCSIHLIRPSLPS